MKDESFLCQYLIIKVSPLDHLDVDLGEKLYEKEIFNFFKKIDKNTLSKEPGSIVENVDVIIYATSSVDKRIVGKVRSPQVNGQYNVYKFDKVKITFITVSDI